MGRVQRVRSQGSNRTFTIESALAPHLSIDQSIAHNGVCLTVEAIDGSHYEVTAVRETLEKSNLGDLNEGDPINLERSVKMETRLDGHLVLGHVDAVATCRAVHETGGSWEMDFDFVPAHDRLVVEKGSIAINGISLTVFNCRADGFRVAVIPYTYHHTNLQAVEVGTRVNLEFDILGKYVAAYLERTRAQAS